MYKNGRLIFTWEDPPPLDVPGRQELGSFPERITLTNVSSSPGGEFVRRAVYVPDLSTFGDDEEWGGHVMTYVGVSDPAAVIRLHVSLAEDWMAAGKWFRGQFVTGLKGDDRWDVFFDQVGGLPIHPEERCMIVDRPEQPNVSEE
jgi:hypothetical protein